METRRYLAWVFLVGAIVAWPATALTVFKDEPQGILGLSFLAIIFTCTDILFTTKAEEQGGK